MPRTRWELTPHEQVEHISGLKELRALGIDVDVPKVHSAAPDLDFEIGYGPPFYNVIFNSPHSGIVLLTGARIVARRSGICLDDNIEVSLPRGGANFQLWYTDGVREKPYRVAPELTLDWEEVLNHRLEQGIRLKQGRILEGLLLLIAFEAKLPKEYQHGERIELQIALIDSLNTEFVAEGTVLVDRRKEATQRPKPRRANPISEDSGLSAVPQQASIPSLSDQSPNRGKRTSSRHNEVSENTIG